MTPQQESQLRIDLIKAIDKLADSHDSSGIYYTEKLCSLAADAALHVFKTNLDLYDSLVEAGEIKN